MVKNKSKLIDSNGKVITNPKNIITNNKIENKYPKYMYDPYNTK